MNPTDTRSRTIVFSVVVLATTAIVIVGMITHTISEGLIIAMSSTPIASILSFFTGRVTAPPTPPTEPPAPAGAQVLAAVPSSPGGRGEPPTATRLATAVRVWWDRRRRPPTSMAAA